MIRRLQHTTNTKKQRKTLNRTSFIHQVYFNHSHKKRKVNAESLRPPLKFQVNIKIQLRAARVSRLYFRFSWLCFNPFLPNIFYTSWKHQKICRFSNIFRVYKMGTFVKKDKYIIVSLITFTVNMASIKFYL